MKALLLIEKLRLVEFIEYFATKKLSQSYYSAPEALVIITIQRMAIEKNNLLPPASGWWKLLPPLADFICFLLTNY
jgi:hypothetical protein